MGALAGRDELSGHIGRDESFQGAQAPLQAPDRLVQADDLFEPRLHRNHLIELKGANPARIVLQLPQRQEQAPCQYPNREPGGPEHDQRDDRGLAQQPVRRGQQRRLGTTM
jgi:hypothetical protein